MTQDFTRRSWIGGALVAAAATGAEAEPPASAPYAAAPHLSLANRAHFLAKPRYRDALVHCFSETLGCGAPMALPAHSGLGPIVAFRFPEGGAVSVEFTELALDEGEARRGAWLELRPADPGALEAAVKAAGLPQVTYAATTTFYFAVPGGQVFGVGRTDRPELKS